MMLCLIVECKRCHLKSDYTETGCGNIQNKVLKRVYDDGWRYRGADWRCKGCIEKETSNQ